MTREECEQVIVEKTREIWNEYLKYNPDGKYLTIAVAGGRILSNNSVYDDDKDTPIDVFAHINNEEDNTSGDDSLLDDQELYPEDYDWEDWKERD